MFEFIVTVLIFIAVIVITAILFGGWVIVKVLGGIGRLLLGPWRHGPALSGRCVSGLVCPRHKCRAKNPTEARFCRRCGVPLPAAQRVSIRRAAVL